MRRAVIVVALLAVCGAALALGATNDSGSKDTTYKIVFNNAFGLTEGGDFKIAGVRAGETSSFKVVGQERPLAVVEARVTEPGFSALREDASCEIRPQSLIGEYFVDCQPGTSDRKLPDGGRVPVAQTSSTIPIDLVNSILRRPYRERLRLIIGELGAGLAGRPEDLSQALRRAHPGLRETSETLEILGRQTATIRRFIVDADRVIEELEARKQDVSRFVREAGTTAEISASRRNELAESFRRLPAFLNELEPYMNRLSDLTGAQTPLLRDLQAASGELDTFLTRLPPFADEGRPAFAALGDASLVGRRAVRKSEEEIRELRKLGQDAPELAEPLRQFLETIDDRARAVEPDPRAAATDPPAGDKTHISGRGGGFTGMEALWNYFYWQTLSTNSLDDVGHVLRLSVLVNDCSPYTTNPSDALLEECAQFLGPDQPGVTTPDPTEGGTAAAAASAEARSTPPELERVAELLTPAPPAAEQPESLTAAPGQGGANGLLDFLLAP